MAATRKSGRGGEREVKAAKLVFVAQFELLT